MSLSDPRACSNIRRQAEAVDEAAGEAGRVGRREGHGEVVAGARLGRSGGGRVLAAPDARGRVEEDPGMMVGAALGGGGGLRHVRGSERREEGAAVCDWTWGLGAW